jgi:hypothetical protein
MAGWWRHLPASTRLPGWLAYTILFGVVSFLFLFPVAHSRRSRAAAEAESFDLLRHAASPAELREAVGNLGIILQTRDGGWIAIRYRDSHAAPGWSSAVARDSGGAWFVSDVHFCGRFQIYRILKERGEDLPEELRSIEDAKELETARELLIGLGFQRVPAPELR